jgi:hypothetical protein
MSTLPRGQFSQSPIHAVLQWMWDQSRSNTLAHLQSCAEQEVERIARDSGISASDFRTLVSLGPNACDPLERRMAALDLDPVEVSEIAPQTFRRSAASVLVLSESQALFTKPCARSR